MRYQPDHKKETRQKLLEATERGFKREGFGGIGIDGLAKEAGATSGAFYGHFKSKKVAFEEALKTGIQQLQSGIREIQSNHGENWLEAFVDFYLTERLYCDLDQSCALQSMTPDVMRSKDSTKTIYQNGMENVVATLSEGFTDIEPDKKIECAWALLSLLSGGVSIARSVETEDVQKNISTSLKNAAKSMIQAYTISRL